MLLEIEALSKSYPGLSRPVLEGVNLTLEAGQSLALTGESGSGKSTLLHLVAGLDRFEQGEITVAGAPLSAMNDSARAALRRHQVGVVFQQFNLIPSLDVAANLSFHAQLAGRVDPDWQAEVASRLGLNELLRRYPEQLSGGQQQRVAIARALAARPALLLADEPTGNLDEDSSDRVMDLMLEMLGQTGGALFLVTHSSRIAARAQMQRHLSGGRIT